MDGMPNTNNTYRKLALLALSAIVTIGIIAVLYHLVIQPRITVIAPVGSSVTITDVTTGSKVTQAHMDTGSVTLSLAAGTYAVQVDGPHAKQVFYASAQTFRNTTVTFTAPDVLPTATISRQVAYDVIPAASGALDFLNTTKRAIIGLDAQGDLNILDSPDNFGSLNSDNPGSAQTLNVIANNQAIVLSGNKLYVLRGGQLQALDTTGFPDSINSIAIGTNSALGSFVIAANQTLYFYSSPDSKPQKLLDISKRFDQLAYGGGKVLVYSTRMPATTDNIKSSYSGYVIDPLLVDINSKSQEAFVSGPIVNAAVSPNGQYATVEQQSSPYTTLYTVSSKSPLLTMWNADTITPFWIDSTHFLYGKGADVWEFNVTAHTAIAIGTMPHKLPVTSITYDTDTNTYYVTTYDSENGATVFRLSDTAPDPNAEQAAALDTATLGNSQFYFSYVNITQPTMLISTNVLGDVSSTASFDTATLQSRQAALDYLHTKGIDTTKLVIVYYPALQ